MKQRNQILTKETQLIVGAVINNKSRWNLAEFPASISDLDFWRLLKISSNNRVLGLFARFVLKNGWWERQKGILKLVIVESNNYLHRLEKTLKFLESKLKKNEIPYLVIKTFKTLPYETMDVDVLVRRQDLDKTVACLTSDLLDFNLETTEGQRHIKNIQGKDLLTIDLHKGDIWGGDVYIDEEFIWKNQWLGKINGFTCPLPGLEAELTMTLAHIIHERFQITLLEFLLIREYCRKINWQLILRQAEKHGWKRSLRRLLAMLCLIEEKIFRKEDCYLREKFNFLTPLPKIISFSPLGLPYVYPVLYGFEVFRERIEQGRIKRVLEIAPYYIYAMIRYWLSGNVRVPMYGHWYKFEN